MSRSIWIYLLVMSVVSFIIRVLPVTLIRRQIKNRFIRSLLYYLPYATLAVMTFPDIVHATQTPASGLLALLVGTVMAWFGASLFKVSAICCVAVFVAERFLVG